MIRKSVPVLTPEIPAWSFRPRSRSSPSNAATSSSGRSRVGAAGPVVVQGGDYFGRTVNLASRVAARAGAGQVLVTAAVAYLVAHSRFGIRLNAIREDEVAAEALGINVTAYKLVAFVLSAIFPAMAGGIQAYKVLYIEPQSVFFVQITIAMALMSMLGGKGTVIGPVVGAVLLYAAQELTWVNFPTAHLIAYGVFIIVVARFMPRGLMGFAIDRGWVRKGMVH